MTPGPQRGAALAAILGLAALFALVERLAQPPLDSRVAHAHVSQNPDEEGSIPVALPHRWAAAGDPPCPDCRSAWYRFDLDREPAPEKLQALWLPTVGRNAAMYLNGQLVAQGGQFRPPAARLGPRSLWTETPAALWNVGRNRLFVLVQADPPRWGAMPALAVGDEERLRAPHRWRELVTVTLPQVGATSSSMLALMLALIWFYRRRQRDHAAAAVAAAVYAVTVFGSLWVEPPLADRAWDLVLALSGFALVGALGALGLQLAPGAATPRRVRTVATGAAVVACGALGLVALDTDGSALGAAQHTALALLAAIGGWLAWQGWRREHAPLITAGSVLALAALSDLGRLGLPGGSGEALPAWPLGVAIALGLAAWQLLLAFVQTLNAVELLKIDLEALVVERTGALHAQFERVRELERAQIVAGERERLMRDMHDGVGGHLVSMLAMIEADRRRPAELATVVRDALTDMRLMIDSLEPVDDDLNAVLAMFHDRLLPRLRAAGVSLHWDVELLPPLPGLTPTRVLHVLRVLQEAVTNAVRHGQAKALWITARHDAGAGHTRLLVRDDGQGFDTGAPPAGRGLQNMRRRMAEVGATLSIESRPGQGTVVSVTLGAA